MDRQTNEKGFQFFYGNLSKQPYLLFLAWHKSWNTMIKEDKEPYCTAVLMSQIDYEAMMKIIGLESEYNLALKKLEDFYGDEEKVIDACMEEINRHPHMVEILGYCSKSQMWQL